MYYISTPCINVTATIYMAFVVRGLYAVYYLPWLVENSDVVTFIQISGWSLGGLEGSCLQLSPMTMLIMHCNICIY